MAIVGNGSRDARTQKRLKPKAMSKEQSKKRFARGAPQSEARTVSAASARHGLRRCASVAMEEWGARTLTEQKGGRRGPGMFREIAHIVG